jgi:multiple sugar transport system substrate-binding protein
MSKLFKSSSLVDHGANRNTGLSRREVLGGMAGAASALALWPVTSTRAIAAATPGTSTGGYKLDLGGYAGPKLTDKPITLRFMRQDFTPEVNALFDNMYKQFSTAYPNISIKEEKVPYGDLPKKLQIYVASGDAPDIMMGRNDFALAYDAGKITLPLQTYFTKEYLADIFDNLRESSTVNGNMYCVPWETNVAFMLFNRNLFSKAGIDTPPETTDMTKGWSDEEFLDNMERLASALKAKGDSQSFAVAASAYGNGGPGSNYSQLESIWIRSLGDPKAPKGSSEYNTLMGVSDDGLKASGYLDTPEAVKGMQNYQRMFTKGLTPTGVVPNQFQSGTAATQFGSGNLATVFDQHNPGFEWGATPFPRGKIPFNCNASDAPVVWSKSKNPAEAVALLAFMCNDTNRIPFHRSWGSMPTRNSLIEQMKEYTTRQPWQLCVTVATGSYGVPRTVGWFDYFNAINPAVKDIALGADPSKRLPDVAKRIDAALAKYK